MASSEALPFEATQTFFVTDGAEEIKVTQGDRLAADHPAVINAPELFKRVKGAKGRAEETAAKGSATTPKRGAQNPRGGQGSRTKAK